MNKKLLAIIPTYRHFEYAQKAAHTFLNTTSGDVLIVDDGSPSWHKVNWNKWPNKRLYKYRFDVNDRNLTRSWNYGLRHALNEKYEFALVGNSDLIFVDGWWDGIERALNDDWDLVGPLTNAPGPKKRQRAAAWLDKYKLTDDISHLLKVQKVLSERHGGKVIAETINGFCMLARTETWWKISHDASHVFDPKYKMTRNEDELQGRALRRGKKIGIVLDSFVFHYRGVSRGAMGVGRYRM